jgi:hypothetical protein
MEEKQRKLESATAASQDIDNAARGDSGNDSYDTDPADDDHQMTTVRVRSGNSNPRSRAGRPTMPGGMSQSISALRTVVAPAATRDTGNGNNSDAPIDKIQGPDDTRNYDGNKDGANSLFQAPARKRDFRSGIEHLQQRREYLRSNLPLPPSLIINNAPIEPAAAVKRRGTPKGGDHSESTPASIPASPEHGSDPRSNKSSPASGQPSPDNRFPFIGLRDKPSPKPLSPSRVHSTEFPLEVHDELCDVIAQLNINRLNRRNVNDDDGALQTLTAILENTHVFMQNSQVSSIIPAHVEILVELLIRAHADGFSSLLSRTCKVIEMILTSASLPHAILGALAEPLSTLANINGLVILAIDTEMFNECMNIIEIVGRARNVKVHLHRLCATGNSDFSV